MTLVIQAISIVLFSLVSAAAPEYAWIAFILYFFVLMFVMTKITGRGLKKAPERKGSPIFKEDQATQIMAHDSLLIKEVKEQFKSTTLMLLLPIVALVLAPMYWQYIDPPVKSALAQFTTNEFLIRFIGFIMFYVFLIAIMQIPRLAVSRLVKQQKQLYVPRTFSLYKDGILIDNRYVQYESDLCFQGDANRKFVEMHGKKIPFIIRLYTIEVSKLASKLKEVGLSECQGQ